MTRRITSAALLTTLLVLFSGACSSSDSDADGEPTKETATSTAADSSTDDTDDTDSTGNTDESDSGQSGADSVSPQEYDATVSAFEQQIDAASGDTCALLDIYAGQAAQELPDPTNPAQVEGAVDLVVQLFTAIADTAPAEYAADGDALRAAVAELQTDAIDHDYAVEWFESEDTNPFDTDEAIAALTTFNTLATTVCADGSSTTGG